MRTSIILVLSGHSGAGKDTVSRYVVAQSLFRRLPTITTRAPRSGETDGVDYHFVTPQRFSEMQARGEISDPVGVHDRYGIPLAALQNAMREERNIILHLAESSAQRVRVLYPRNAILVHISAPSPEEATARLLARGMTYEEIARRRENDPPSETQTVWDLEIVNEIGDPEKAASQLLQHIASRQ